ncbi:MAG: zinc metalloprotease HtpX [Patescibacteria group bacterium]
MNQTIQTTLLLGALTGLFLFVGNMIGGQQGMLVGFIFAAIMNFGTYFFSDKLVLAQYGAKEADRARYSHLYSLIENLARQANLPMPKVYVIDMPTPNAFATGRDANHAVVAVSPSIMQALTDEELTAVLAHELGHVKNGDMLVSTIAATIAGAISYLANMAMYFGPSMRSRDDDRGGNPLGLLFMVIVTPIAATLLHLAISRSREFLADEYSGHLTRRPLALANALRKISGYAQRYPMEADPGHNASAHLFIINPFDASLFAKLFSTHPPLHERIAKLEAMAR